MRARVAVPMLAVVAMLAIAVVGWVFVADWNHFAAGDPLSSPASTSDIAGAEAGLSVGAAAVTPHHSVPAHHAPTTPPPATSRPAHTPHPAATTPAAPAPHPPAPPTTTAPPPAAAPIHFAPVGPSPSGAAAAVFNELNRERAGSGLAPLRWSAKLATSATQHTDAMVNANTLSHQLPGEPYFGTRISNAGYAWSTCGENIGENTDAVAIQQSFYAEGPGGIHHDNTMSTTFVDVGIGVVYANGMYWLTEDFGRPQ